MTRDEMDAEIGRALRERQELTAKAECLRHLLRTYGRAYAALADSPFEEKNREIADRAVDLRSHWDDLKETLDRIAELNRLLDLGKAT